MKRIRQVLVASLVLMLLLCLLSVAASAATITASGSCGENVTWTLDSDGVLTVSGTGDIVSPNDSGILGNSYRSSVKTIRVESGVTGIGAFAFTYLRNLTSVNLPSSLTGIGDNAFSNCSSLTDVSIPAGVTSIGNSAFSNCSNLTSVTLPESVTDIGEYAFYRCGKLAYVTLPSNLTSIERSVFSNCSSLTDVTIPSGVTSIGSYAFYSCKKLTSVDIPSSVTSIGEAAYKDCSGLTGVTIAASVTTIGSRAFDNCKNLTSVDIPSSVTVIGNYAFVNCSSLTNVTIPTGLTSIADHLFNSCSSLTSVIIPEGVTSIGDYAFSNCRNITSVTLPSSLTAIGDSAFSSCYKLTSVSIPAGVTVIENYVFSNCSSLTSVTLPAGLTGIGNYAFSKCSLLADVTIPASMTVIGERAFSSCSSVQTVTIPGNVAEIGAYAFDNCSSLTGVVLNEGLRVLGNGAFYQCGNLAGITIPAGVTSIGDYAFSSCRSLSSVVIPESVQTIGARAFAFCSSLQSMSIPAGVTAIGNYAFLECSSLIRIDVDENNTAYCSDQGILLNGDRTTLITCPQMKTGSYTIPATVTSLAENAFYHCAKITGVTIPEGITRIEDSTFEGCTKMASVNIPESVTSIGSRAFRMCNALQNLTIPSGVTSIGSSAFYYNSRLTSLVIPEGITTIEDSAFALCSSLTRVTIPSTITSIQRRAFYYCTSLTGVTIPEGVTFIGESAFSTCSRLTSVTIPKSVSVIGDSAFDSCSKLTDVYYSGSPELWNSISIGIMNDALTGAALHTTLSTLKSGTCGSSVNWVLTADYTLTIYGTGEMTGYGAVNQFTNTPWKQYQSSIKNVRIISGVTSIGSGAFNNCSALLSVEIPDTVTSIGDGAFYNCSGISSISLPDGVSSIGAYAFYRCMNLKSIEIPGNVTVLSEGVFSNCTGLTSITLPESITTIGQNAFSGCTGLTSITLPESITSIGQNAFSGCSALKDVYYAGTIGDWAKVSVADGNDALGSAAMHYGKTASDSGACGDGVRWQLQDGTLTISGSGAMTKTPWRTNYALDIISAVIENGVTNVGDIAFSGCENLQTVSISDSVTRIGMYAFRNCSSLPVVALPDSVTSIDFDAFENCTSLEAIRIPESVETIENSAFSGCDALETVELSNTLTDVADGAFSNCSHIQTIVFHGTAADWHALGLHDAFSYVISPDISFAENSVVCSGTCGDDLTWTLDTEGKMVISGQGEIQSSAWSAYADGYNEYYLKLRSVEIESGATSIQSYTFSGYPYLTQLWIPETLTVIGYNAFQGCPIESVVFEGNENVWSTIVIDSGNTALQSAEITSLNQGCYVDGGKFGTNDLFWWKLDKEGHLFVALRDWASGFSIPNYRMTSTGGNHGQPWGSHASDVTALEISGEISSIGDYAFCEMPNLTSLSLPAGLKSIGINSFSNCSGLTQVTIPDSVTTINSYAFSGCASLASIQISDAVSRVGFDAFSMTAYVNDRANYENGIAYLGTVAIASDKNISTADLSKATVIADGALINTDVERVIFSDQLKTIGSDSFAYCSNLTELRIPDSVTTLGTYAFKNCDTLQTAVLPAGIKALPGSLFAECPALTSVVIPEGVTSIGGAMLWGCTALKEVTLPATLETVISNAFAQCDALTDVYYGGTREQWENVRINTGNDALTAAKVHYPLLAEITQQPADQLVFADQNAAFTVEATGLIASYQWYCQPKNSEEWIAVDAQSASTNTLVIQASAAMSGQRFCCVVTDPNGEQIVSDSALLTVQSAQFIIVSQPESFYGAVGDTAVFTVQTEGDADSYLWYYSTDGGETWNQTWVKGYATDTLQPVLRANNSGRLFKCVITDAEGTTVETEPAVMALLSGDVTIVNQPADYLGQYYSSATFHVEAEGENLTYLWYYRNSDDEAWVQSWGTGYNTDTLTVTLLPYRDGRQFRCEIRSGGENPVYTETVVMALARSAVTITEQPTDVTAKLMTLTQFHAAAKGENLTYRWYVKQGAEAEWELSYNDGCNTDTLNVRLYEYRDGYQYKCEIKSGGSNAVFTEPATLRMIAKTAAITQQPENVSTEANQTVTFTVGATGEGLSYQWQYRKSAADAWANTSMSGNQTDTLTVIAIAARSGYEFRCAVTDSSGAVTYSRSAALKVGTLPKIVSQPESWEGAVGDSAVFAVTAEGEGLTYQWYYKDASGTWTASGAADAQSPVFTVAVQAYRNGYQYRCAVTNAEGLTIYSEPATLTISG